MENAKNNSRRGMRLLGALLAAALLAAQLAGCTLGTGFDTAGGSSQTASIAQVSQVGQASQGSGTATLPAGLSVHVLDVGQGDSIFISCEGQNMLIDAGVPEMGARVTAYLSKYGVKKLDDVVCTHPHDDHIGGMPAVLQQEQVGRILMTRAQNNTAGFEKLLNTIAAKGLKITEAVPGARYTLGGASFVIFAPNGSYTDLNNTSVVLKLTYHERSFLFTGDAETQSETDMLKKGWDLKADVLKVGHHGSSTSTGAKFLKAVSPQYAAISVGAGNDYGHPTPSTLARLQKAGVTVLRTDQSGTIVFTSDGKSLNETTEK